MSKPIATEAGVARAQDAAIDAMDATIEALRGRRHSQLEIQLHDGHVVKLMGTEKFRLFEAGAAKPHCTDAG